MFPVNLCKNKEQVLGKLVKIYIAQVLLKKGEFIINIFIFLLGFSSIQEQGINLLTEFLIKCIRSIGHQAQRVSELQGRQESNILHVLIALDQRRVSPNEILSHMKQTKYTNDPNLNYLLQGLMESIFKDKYAIPQEEYPNNLRNNQNKIMAVHLVNQNSKQLQIQKDQWRIPNPSIEDQSNAFYILFISKKKQQEPQQKKEITEKELKDYKKKIIIRSEEEEFDKVKQEFMKQSQKRKSSRIDMDYDDSEILNPFNAPMKKYKTTIPADKLFI